MTVMTGISTLSKRETLPNQRLNIVEMKGGNTPKFFYIFSHFDHNDLYFDGKFKLIFIHYRLLDLIDILFG